MNIFKTALAVASPFLLGKGIEYAATSGASYFEPDSMVGGFLSGAAEFGTKLADPEGLLTGAVKGIGDAMYGDKMKFPEPETISPTSVAARQLSAAGQASSVPLGNSNRVPNMLNNSRNARSMISRVQTIGIPRSNISTGGQTIKLASSKMPKSKVS
tara:strand:+ start:1261 stop:1731 length:471 start_codon:yes stop_codon:yes gene_type:complete